MYYSLFPTKPIVVGSSSVSLTQSAFTHAPISWANPSDVFPPTTCRDHVFAWNCSDLETYIYCCPTVICSAPAQHMVYTTGKESIPVWLCEDTGVTKERRANIVACILKVETDLQILAVRNT